MKNILFLLLISLINLLSCGQRQSKAPLEENKELQRNNNQLKYVNFSNDSINSIHVFVALCDNKNQGIVPVSGFLGNGQEPDNNLYWGSRYGVRTFFERSKEWELLKTQKIGNLKLERLIFKHKRNNYFLVADAYDGKYIKECTKDFLFSCSGQLKDTLIINGEVIGISGNSKLLSYIGHDGLMEFRLKEDFKNNDRIQRDCIILACKSKKFFSYYLQNTKANPILWTTDLMAPEAYILHDALSSYIKDESPEEIKNKAVLAYSKYQKISFRQANDIFISGW